MLEPQAGRPFEPPTLEQIEQIVKSVRENMSLNLAAMAARLHPYRIERWMMQGSDDAKNLIDSKCAHLFKSVRENQSLKAQELLKKIETCPKNWQALAWKL